MAMNPDSEWKELTCDSPCPDMPAGELSVFRNRQGEVTLDRPAEGVYSATVERDPEAFAKQYRRAARLQEMRQSGVVAPVHSGRSPVASSRPSEASPWLVDDYLEELELEPEPELEEERHGRAVYVRGKMHRLGRNLWVGNIPDRLLADGVVACEKALQSLFSRFGTVEKVTVREKYTESSSTRRVGMQSWAMVGFSSACHDAVDLAVATEVTLSGAKLEVKELLAKGRLSGRDLSDEGSLPEKWVEFKTSPADKTPLGLATSRAVCCFRKTPTSGKWYCECNGLSTRKQTTLGGITRQELKAAFLLFDIDGDGVIDADELSSTMRALAKAGRMRAPSDAQIAKMMAEADEDGDGEIDFDEFCELITNCDLHPSTCTRCEQSQYFLTEDYCFGEPRPQDPDADRPVTCRKRMAARDEKLIHFSFAVIATGAPVQTVLVVLGAAFWLGLSDQRGGTHYVLIAGLTSVVMTTFAVTIGCASRPVIRGAFLIYALWELVVMIVAVIVIGDVVDSTEQCELSPGTGEAAVPTSSLCPQLVASAPTINDAKELCLNSTTERFCDWSDKCSIETTPGGCVAVLPAGTCILTEDGQCRVADSSAPARDEGVLDLWGTCVPTTGCRYNVFLQVVGWSLCTMGGVTLMAIVNILNDSRFPLGLQIASRRKMSMWTVALQMSLDPGVHAAKGAGVLSQRYSTKHRSASIHGAAFAEAVPDSRDKMPPEIMLAADGTAKVRPRGLGV